MAEELIFYTHPMSRGRIVRWMLEEVGHPYETEIMDYATTLKSADYRRINPMAKIPALKHKDVVVTEAAAICAYLADAFPASNLAPALENRGIYYRWLFFTAGPLEQSCVTKALGFEVRQDQEGMVGYGNHATMLGALQSLLSSQEFAAGSQFSAADVYLASQIQWNLTMGVIEELDVFVDYSNRMHGRSASIRAAAIDDELAAKLQASS